MPRSTNDQILQGFIEEVNGYIPVLLQGVASLKENPEDYDTLKELHRLTHIIKGASSLIGISGLSHIAYQMEEAIEDIIEGTLDFKDAIIPIMEKTISQFQECCQRIAKGKIVDWEMLKNTILAYRRYRNLSLEEDDEILNLYFESFSQDKEDIAETIEPIENIILKEETGYELFPEILAGYRLEAEEHLEDLGRALSVLESQVTERETISPKNKELIGQIRRSVHTLKGAAGTVDRKEVVKWTHSMEDLLDWLFEEAIEITPEIIIVLLESTDLLENFVSNPQSADPVKILSLGKLHKKIVSQGQKQTLGEDSYQHSQNPVIDMEILEPTESDVEAPFQLDKKESIFEQIEVQPEEYSEQVLPQPGKTLRVETEKIDQLVNLAGELLIALSACDQKMGVFAGILNEMELSRSRICEIARDMEVGYEVKAIQRQQNFNSYSVAGGTNVVSLSAASIGAGAASSGEFNEFDSLELDRYSEFNLIIRTLNESVVDIGTINSQTSDIYSDFVGHFNRQRIILSELQDKMMRIRMAPMSVILNKMRRIVRETSKNLGKQIKFHIKGDEIELDKLLWEKISDPLMHLLRNSVDHGIEPPALRLAMGKEEFGEITLMASREGNQVILRIKDNGSGLNYSAIKNIGRSTEYADKIDSMNEDELASLIFLPGFSTSTDVTEISGRGVGLDVVKKNIQDIKGNIKVTSETGLGAEFTIRIPLTLAVVNALIFIVEGRTFTIAMNEIIEIMRINTKDIMIKPEKSIKIKNEIIPLYYLAELLSIKVIENPDDTISDNPVTLIVKANGKKRALIIDSYIGQKEIVIKNLGSHLQKVRGMSGATIMGDGSVVPILNIEQLFGISLTTSASLKITTEPKTKRTLNILVVDDSVSIRIVVSRLLEDRGFRIQAAKDGIEAMEKVRELPPDLIVLDIEMPRMNGYEFLSAAKSQPMLKQIPIIMLTSRTADKHREKAMSLGANGFLVKPYKNDELIRLIQELT